MSCVGNGSEPVNRGKFHAFLNVIYRITISRQGCVMAMSEIKKQKLDVFVASALSILIYISFFTNAFAKVIASIAYSLCFLFFIIRLFVLKKAMYRNGARSYYLVLLVYFAALAISLIYTPDLGDGILRFQGQTKLLMALILIETVTSAADARKYLYAGMAGGTVLSIMILYQGMVNHMDRPGGIWNPVHAGVLLVFLTLLVLILLLYERKTRLQVMFGILFLIHGLALYVNGTRGAWLALTVALIVLPLFTNRLNPAKKIIYYCVGALFIVVLLQTTYFQARLHYSIDDIKQSSKVRTETSFGGRYEMWKASTIMFLDNPVLGVGLGGWGGSIKAMVMEKKVSPEVLNYNQAHSIYFDVLSTRGVTGFITFMVLISYPVYFVWRKRDGNTEMFRALVIVITTAFLAAGLTDTLVYIRGVFIFYIMLIGAGLAGFMVQNGPESVTREHR